MFLDTHHKNHLLDGSRNRCVCASTYTYLNVYLNVCIVHIIVVSRQGMPFFMEYHFAFENELDEYTRFL